MKSIIFLSLLLLLHQTAKCQNADSLTTQSIYHFLKLKNCDKNDCTSYLTDSTSRKKLVLYDNHWIELIYPLGEFFYKNQRYRFNNDLKAIDNSDLRFVTFNPESIVGYLCFNAKKKFIIISGGIQGSAGIASNYSLIVILNLNVKTKGKYIGYGLITSGFSIENVNDFNGDGKIDLRLRNNRGKLKVFTLDE